MTKSIKRNGLILTLLVILSLFAQSSAVQFIFTPSPNIGVYQLAHYQCSVDHTGVGITWLVNGTGSADNKIIKLGIVTSGAGSSNSSLTIPGYSQYNNTVVRCNAFGIVNGNSYFNFNQATLKIQDKLSKVENFTCNPNGYYYINCSWSPPFSLGGVPIYDYVINVTKEGDNTQYTSYTNTTSWMYHPSQFDNYTISIAGNNSAGVGNMTYQSLILSNITISNYFVTTEKTNSNWRTTFILKNATFLYNKQSYVLSHLTPINNDTSPVDGQGSGQFEGDTFIGTVNMGELPEKKKWMISFLIYNSGLYYINVFNISQPTEFSTFNVINGSLKVNKTDGKVCFACYFVEGSQVQGCFVKYKCLKTDFNGNTTIERTSESDITKCVPGIHSSIYNVTFYDLDFNNMTYEDNYAIKLTSQSVDGLSSPRMTSTPTVPLSTDPPSSTDHDISSSIDTSSSTDVSSSIDVSSSPTMLCTDCTNIGNNQRYLSVVIGGIMLLMIVILLIVTFAVISVIICHKTKKKNEPLEMSIVIESPQVTVNKVLPVSNEVN